MSQNPLDYDRLADICTNWWRSLQEHETKDGKHLPANRAALAQLRRVDIIDLGGMPAIDIGCALGVLAFRNLIARLRAATPELTNWHVKRWLDDDAPVVEPFGIAAVTLAHIRGDAGGRKCGATGRQLGSSRGEGASDDHLFAEPRFKRLIRTRDDWPGLLAQARRIAAILEREAPIGDLGASLILWNADQRITRDWAFQYYQCDFQPAIFEPEAVPANS